MGNKKELKSCPICKNEARLCNDMDGVAIECKGCGLLLVKDTEEDVIESWNTRLASGLISEMAACAGISNESLESGVIQEMVEVLSEIIGWYKMMSHTAKDSEIIARAEKVLSKVRGQKEGI